ncbi:MAG: DUF4423 domain-containing protein [Bdellovibrionota bacterium]
MKKRSIFEFSTYKEAMAAFLLAQRGQLSRAAEALSCQPSFLSRVMNSEIHLTPDHAFLLSEFWRLGAEEKEYFQAMVEHERAANAQFRASLKARLTAMKRAQENLQQRTSKEGFPVSQQEALYFSSWHWSALHFLVSVPKFQNVKALASRLGLSEELVLTYLRRLESFGFVTESRGTWRYASGQFHVPKDSPFVVMHHQNWRTRAVVDAQNPASEGIHYTTVLTLSLADVERLKALLLNFISESESIARPSDPQESVVLNCDLFRT